MAINTKEDILSITELEKNTPKILKQIHSTHRPVVLTVNGKAEDLIEAIKYIKAKTKREAVVHTVKDFMTQEDLKKMREGEKWNVAMNT